MYVCNLCNKKLRNSWAFLAHLRWEHHASEESLEDFIELKGDKILMAVLKKVSENTEKIDDTEDIKDTIEKTDDKKE